MEKETKLKFTGERFHIGADVGIETAQEHLLRYQSVKLLTKNKCVLDAACGEGYGAKIIASVAKSITGIDCSKETIEHAANKYQTTSNLSFDCCSVAALPYNDNTFDVVVSFETIEHLNEADQKAFIKEVNRVLKPEGLFIISTPNRSVYNKLRHEKNPFHLRELDLEEFTELLNPFKIHHVYKQSQMVFSSIWNETELVYKSDTPVIGSQLDAVFYIIVSGGLKSTKPDLHLNMLSYSKDVSFNQQRIYLQKKENHIQKLSSWGKSLDKECTELKVEHTKLKVECSKMGKELIELKDYLREAEKHKASGFKAISTKLSVYIKKLTDASISRGIGVYFNDQGVQWNLLALRQSRFLTKTSTTVIYRGKIKDHHSVEPIEVYIKMGQRRIVANLGKKDKDGFTPFEFKFTTRPGFKFLKFKARLLNGKLLNLGYRIILCSKKQPDYSSFNTRNFLLSRPTPIQPETIEIPSSEKPLVSIIIPVFNQTDYTLQCLQSVVQNTKEIAYEVIVVDDCSTERAIHQLTRVKGLILHRNKTNLGFIKNCNLGAAMARGAYVVMLNNDTEVQPGWLNALLDTFRLHPDAGLVGAKLIYPDGRLQEAGGIVWSDGTAWNYGHRSNPHDAEYAYVKEVDYCSGAAVMIEKALYDELGGFDLRYVPAYYEDTDMAFKVRLAGKKVYFQPAAQVIHYEGISNGTDTSTGLKQYQVANRQKFFEAWKETLLNEHYPNAQNVFRARERSMHRPTILVIDHYLPRYDRDAGSLNIFHYLQAFTAANFSVKFLPANLEQVEPYQTKLQQLGIEVLFGDSDFSVQNWFRDNGMDLDYILLSRAHIAVDFLDLLDLHTNAKRLFYGHDLLSRTHERTYKVTGDDEARKESVRWRKWEDEVFKRVDAIFYPSKEEIKYLHKIHPKLSAAVLPPFLFNNTASNDNLWTENYEKRNGLLFVGGYNHTPNCDAVLWFCEHVLPGIRKEIPNIHLTLAGASPTREVQALACDWVTVTGYVSEEELTSLYNNTRLVIAPLRLGGGIKGKIIEAIQHGVPVVTTEVGAEGIPRSHHSLIVASETEFAKMTIEAYKNINELHTKTKNASLVLEEYYSRKAFYKSLLPFIPELGQIDKTRE